MKKKVRTKSITKEKKKELNKKRKKKEKIQYGLKQDFFIKDTLK
jgi:hypothetical protein